MFWLKNTSCCLWNIFHWYKILLHLVFFTLLPGPCLRKALSTSQHTKLTSLNLTLTNGNTYSYGPFGYRARVSYSRHRCLHGNPMDEACLCDRQQQLLWLLGPGQGLRLNAFPQIRALSPGWRLHSWGVGGDPGGWGGPQRGRTHKREILSGCQTSRLAFLIHQSITIQRFY